MSSDSLAHVPLLNQLMDRYLEILDVGRVGRRHWSSGGWMASTSAGRTLWAAYSLGLQRGIANGITMGRQELAAELIPVGTVIADLNLWTRVAYAERAADDEAPSLGIH